MRQSGARLGVINRLLKTFFAFFCQKIWWVQKIVLPLHSQFGNEARALSSVGSERLPYKQRVGGSNPSAPTTENQEVTNKNCLIFLFLGRNADFRNCKQLAQNYSSALIVSITSKSSSMAFTMRRCSFNGETNNGTFDNRL